MNYRRLFVGIALAPSLSKRALSKVEKWKEYPIRFTTNENMHLTLAFLGLVKDEELDRVCQEIDEAASQAESFELHFDRIALAPVPGDGARMVWMQGPASEELAKLRNELEKSISNFDPEYKSFSPHVTIGKILRTKWAKLDPKPDLVEEVKLLEMVGGITLFESVSENGKRKYIPLAEFELK